MKQLHHFLTYPAIVKLTRFIDAFQIAIIFITLLFVSVSCSEDDPAILNEQDPEPQPTEFEVPAISDIVMYEVNIRAFGPGSDFNAVIDRLDAIKAQNVNVIWLMPIHPVGEVNSVNSPYAVKDYKAVNPEFGTMAEFKTLVEEAHSRNIAVIIDWIANHTAWDNNWIENKSWYSQDGSGNIISPPGTGWNDVADLNFDSQEMRAAMIEAMKFWIEETDIDGYRCDAADFVPFDFWQEALNELISIPEKELVLLAEGARTDHFDAGFQINYGWEFYGKLKDIFAGEQSAYWLYTTHNSEYDGLPEGTHRLRFTTNHDESAWDATPMVLFNGKEGAFAASVITTLLGGIPLIYGSQEVGTYNNIPFFSQSTINWSANPDLLTSYQDLFAFYANSEVVRYGELETYNHSQVICFKRVHQQNEVLVLVNTSQDVVSYQMDPELQNSQWIDGLDGSDVTLGMTVQLGGYACFIFESL